MDWTEALIAATAAPAALHCPRRSDRLRLPRPLRAPSRLRPDERRSRPEPAPALLTGRCFARYLFAALRNRFGATLRHRQTRSRRVEAPDKRAPSPPTTPEPDRSRPAAH